MCKAQKPILKQALEYHRRGWCIIPIGYRTKKPPLVNWTKYQTQRPTEAQIRKWFSGNNRNIAVVLGEVSGGLSCRDYDEETGKAEYKFWIQEHPELARQLPIQQTADGYHVYFEADVEGIKHFKDERGKKLGELRGAGGYCLLPPSEHPDGPVYQWVNPPNGSILVVDPELAGFIPKNEDVTEHVEQSEQYQQAEQTEARVRGVSIEEAINSTLPKKVGTRNQKTFELVRELSAFEELKDAGTAELEPIFNRWYERAKPNIRTDYDESWFDFLYAWENVIFPKGVEMAHIFERAKNATVPEFAMKYRSPKKRLLVCLCKELQKQAGNKAFWLSTRTAADYLEITPMTAWRYLFVLVKEAILDEVEKGGTKAGPRKATRFRYIAN